MRLRENIFTRERSKSDLRTGRKIFAQIAAGNAHKTENRSKRANHRQVIRAVLMRASETFCCTRHPSLETF
jgi:hypothetical protein